MTFIPYLLSTSASSPLPPPPSPPFHLTTPSVTPKTKPHPLVFHQGMPRITPTNQYHPSSLVSPQLALLPPPLSQLHTPRSLNATPPPMASFTDPNCKKNSFPAKIECEDKRHPLAAFIGGKAQVGPTHLRKPIKKKREATWSS